MPWDNQRPRAAKYGREHQAERRRRLAALQRAGAGICAERICIKRSRVITPDMDLHLCHDETGTVVLGLGHAACNTREAAIRGNRRRYHPPRHTTERSHLKW